MKILLATGIFPPEIGGPATLAPQLAKGLKGLGHEVTVITYTDSEQDIDQDQYDFPVIGIVRGSKISNYLRFFFKLLKELRKNDICLTLDYFSVGVPLYFATRFVNKPYVVRLGGGFIWERYLMSGGDPLPLKDFYEKHLHQNYPTTFNLVRKVLRGAKALVFNSVNQPEFFQIFYGLNHNKMETIYNPMPAVSDDPWRPNHESKEIIYAGRLSVAKNIMSVIQALKKVQDKEVHLTIIGDGPSKDDLVKEVKHLGLEGRVSFEDRMTKSELKSRVEKCRFTILASWTDISPNQVYEQLAWKIPFLVTQQTYLAFSELVHVKIDPKSVEDIARKIDLLMQDNQYKEHVDNLSKISFRHSWDDMIDEYHDILKSVI